MADIDAIGAYEQSLENLYMQADASAGVQLASTRLRKRNMLLLRRRSLQIAQFLDGDFSSMGQELRLAFPSGAETMPTRIYPLLARVSEELATIYAKRPQRFFFGQPDKAGGTGLSQEVYKKFRDVYERSGVDDVLQQACRQLIPQQTQVLMVLPCGPRRVTVQALNPYQVFVVPGNALTARDITTAKEVRLRLPVAANDDTVMLGWAVFTPAECYWDVDGTKTSLFDRKNPDNLANPWPGTIPLIGLHSAEPPPGCFLSSLADDLLHEQIGINLAVSQLEHMARHSSPIKVIQPGPDGGLASDAAEGMPTGSDQWVALPGPGSSLGVVQPQPMLGEYRQLIDWQTGLTANFHDVSPDAFSKSPAAKTSVSRAYDRADRAEHRQRYERIFTPVETALGQLIAQVVNLDGSDTLQLPDDVDVQATYAEPDDSPADPVHEMQALLMSFRSGLDNPVDYLVRTKGISKTTADQKVTDNLTVWKKFAAMMPSDAMNIDAPLPKADQ